MKKILLVLVALFIANLGCKKIDEDNGGGLCACSPIAYGPNLLLVIKNAAGTDLLNPSQAGAYAANQVKIFYKDASGAEKPVDAGIQPAFSYGTEKFNYYSLNLNGVIALANANLTFYLKLGDTEAHELHVELDNEKRKIAKLSIDKIEMPMDNGSVKQYVNVFYFTQ